MRKELRALLICDHIPYKDPRVMWHIESLLERYKVDVAYLNRTNESVAQDKMIPNVRYITCPHEELLCPKKNTIQQESQPVNIESRPTWIAPRMIIPIIAQTAYSVRISISNTSLKNIYDWFYRPARLVYRSGRKIRKGLYTSWWKMREELYRTWRKIVEWCRAILDKEFRGLRKVREGFWSLQVMIYLTSMLSWVSVTREDLQMLKLTFERMKNILSMIESEYDLIIASDLPVLRTGSYIKKIVGGVLIYDAHENWSRVRPGTPSAYAVVMTGYERWFGFRADIVTTVSPLLVKHLGNVFPTKNVVLLPNAAPFFGSNARSDGSNGRIIVEKYFNEMGRISKNRLVAIFLGGVAPERGLRELIGAWRHIPSDEAILVVRAPKGRNDELNAVISMAASNGTLGETVFFLPSVDEDELIYSASVADVGIIPYKPTFENHIMACPNKLSQYMQAGIAVLSNNISFPKEIIQRAKCGLIYCDDDGYDGIVDAIMCFRRDEVKLREYGRNARKYCESNYNWELYYGGLRNAIDAVEARYGSDSKIFRCE